MKECIADASKLSNKDVLILGAVPGVGSGVAGTVFTLKSPAGACSKADAGASAFNATATGATCQESSQIAVPLKSTEDELREVRGSLSCCFLHRHPTLPVCSGSAEAFST